MKDDEVSASWLVEELVAEDVLADVLLGSAVTKMVTSRVVVFTIGSGAGQRGSCGASATGSTAKVTFGASGVASALLACVEVVLLLVSLSIRGGSMWRPPSALFSAWCGWRATALLYHCGVNGPGQYVFSLFAASKNGLSPVDGSHTLLKADRGAASTADAAKLTVAMTFENRIVRAVNQSE
jgi:hypothetical protein